jgi:hypothetical protein
VAANETSLDLATCVIDPARTYGYVTVLRPDKHLLFGYVFRREEFPWLMSWMNYSGDARAARGGRILHPTLRRLASGNRRRPRNVRHANLQMVAGEG